MEDAIRRRRRLRHLQERRRRAAIRRRNALMIAALMSAAIGAVVGSGAGGETGGAASPPKLARGGVGPPPDTGDMVHSKKPVPVLMYHVIANAPADAQIPELFVKPIRFRAQMAYLDKHGYTAVSLGQVYAGWKSGGLLPSKPVVVSFDDGYRGDYTDAMPILAAHHWPGVLDLQLGAVEDGELTAAMVNRMLDSGWELASHTISHLDLTRMHGSDLRREVDGSRALLRRRFHVPVDFFCYPSGHYNALTVAAVRRAGYLGATTTQEGLASGAEMYKLRRIRVNGTDGVSGLNQKLKAAGT
jgi:peptidoglycan/xylan/chitin deacetylase (PgdA/CDA1 family)